MNIFLDIDNTICRVGDGPDKYAKAEPIIERIAHANRLYDKGHRITYWTARGKASGTDHSALTRQQLAAWNAKYHELRFDKPAYDLYVDDKSQHSDAYFNNILPPPDRVSRPTKIPKGWGHELIIVNTPKYCGKILHFRAGGRFSMHFHIQKTETWYVASGRFEFRYIDTANASHHSRILTVGDVITNEIGQPHQIICQEEGDIFETSTQHFDSDSYRVAPGDSQLDPLRSPNPLSSQVGLLNESKPPLCPCDLPNGLFLGHLGLGDQILLAPAMRTAAATCNTLYVICKDIYVDTLHNLLSTTSNIAYVPIPNITDVVAESAAINKAVAALPQPLMVYSCGNFHPSPAPLTDFPLCFYKDLGIPWPASFTWSQTVRSAALASMLAGVPYIFVHDVSSTKSIDLNAKLRAAHPNHLIVNPERNAYEPNELEYRLADHFIRSKNSLTIIDYKDTIEGANHLHLIGSCFFCFAATLETKAATKVVYNRCAHRYPTLTKGTWQIQPEDI